MSKEQFKEMIERQQKETKERNKMEIILMLVVVITITLMFVTFNNIEYLNRPVCYKPKPSTTKETAQSDTTNDVLTDVIFYKHFSPMDLSNLPFPFK